MLGKAHRRPGSSIACIPRHSFYICFFLHQLLNSHEWQHLRPYCSAAESTNHSHSWSYGLLQISEGTMKCHSMLQMRRGLPLEVPGKALPLKGPFCCVSLNFTYQDSL